MSPTRSARSLDAVQRRRGVFLLSCVGAALSLAVVRLVYINAAQRDHLVQYVRGIRRGHAVLPARRGTILDARGRVVAISTVAPDLFVDPALVRKVDRLSGKLATIVGKPAGEIAETIRRRRHSRFVVIARHVDAGCAAAVHELGHPAVGLSPSHQRTYPLGTSMAHALGWVGRDAQGLGGVELSYNDHLRGHDGRQATLRDARRRALQRIDLLSVAPVDGGHVVLTLDAEIQRIAENALSKGIADHQAQSGVALVMDPGTGDILAMACLPAFDPNEPVDAVSLPLRRNRILTDPVEPGSTFKPFVMSGALDGEFVFPGERIDCHMGRHRFGSRVVTDTHPHGILDVAEIIIKSSNIGMGIIGRRMGRKPLYETLRRFGFGRPTGIGLRSENAGVLYPLRRWTEYSETSIPMGYEVLVTPLQLIRAFAAIVNDGLLVRPRLVKALLAPDGKVLQRFDEPKIIGRAVSSRAAGFLAREVLPRVVTESGGRNAQIGDIPVLGKTGTVKLTYDDRSGYEPGAYLSLFLGAAPVQAPRYVALVMIRRPNPATGYYGAAVAAPVVGHILHDVQRYRGESRGVPDA